MKKTLFLAILAGAALAGCVKNEEAIKSDTSPERIKFDAPVVSVPTRAEEIYGNYPKDKDFGVYALQHKGEFSAYNANAVYMTNVQCKAKKDDGTDVGPDETPAYWAPVTTYYWPKEGHKLTFAAYAPWMASGVEWGAKGFKFTDFTVKDDPTQQIDLLYSELVTNQTKNSVVADQPYDGVAIPFKHALSSIVFKAKTQGNYIVEKTVDGVKVPDETKSTIITLESITVKNVINKGTFTQDLTANDSDTWTFADVNADGKPDNVKDYKVFPKDGTTVKELTQTADYVNGEPDEAADQYGNTTGNEIPKDPNKKNDGKRRSDLILIPQQSLNDIIVTIEYSIKTGTALPVSYTHDFKMKAGATTAADNDKWKMGMRYIYTISIGLNEIKFCPQVYNWTDVESDLVEIQ